MMPRNFPPADQCSPDDLDAIADLVVSDPSASYDLAGSREHIEALCRRYQALIEMVDDLTVRDGNHEQARERLGKLASEALAKQEAAVKTAAVMERALAAATNDLDATRTEIRALAITLDAERNERQAEVLEADAERDRCTAALARVELAERIASGALRLIDRADVTARDVALLVEPSLALDLIRERRAHARTRAGLETALRRLEEQQETHAANERLRSAFADACLGVTGQTIEQVNIQLDAELAAHPDAGPLHHARDQRDHQEDTTP